MNKNTKDELNVRLRDPNSKELKRISNYSMDFAFKRKSGRGQGSKLRAIRKEESIKWLLRAVQSYNGVEKNAIQHIIELNGKTAGSVIVTKDEACEKSHTAIFEIYLRKEKIGVGFEGKVIKAIEEEIHNKWQDKVRLLKALCSNDNDMPYLYCGFTRAGILPQGILSSAGICQDETVLYKKLD